VSTETGPLTAGSLDELVAGATDRVEVRSSDAKSGSRFETLRIDGVPTSGIFFTGADTSRLYQSDYDPVAFTSP